jgi:hypothetical protein
MSNVELKKILEASADKVWASISAFDGIERYLPAVRSSSVQGQGVGCLRTCTLTDGVVLRERLVAIDPETRTLRYELVEAPFPIEGYVATMEVRELTQGRCEFRWSSKFQVKDGPAAVFEGIFAQAYAAGADGLERLHRG